MDITAIYLTFVSFHVAIHQYLDIFSGEYRDIKHCSHDIRIIGLAKVKQVEFWARVHGDDF